MFYSLSIVIIVARLLLFLIHILNGSCPLFMSSVYTITRISKTRSIDSHLPVADLGFSKGGFWFYKKLSSELAKEQKKKKGCQPSFVNISQAKFASSYPDTLCLTYSYLNNKKGAWHYFQYISTSMHKISGGFLKSQRGF